ncbi:hypothetical protein MTO96_038398 [Rhipicephalus appendiculatus]
MSAKRASYKFKRAAIAFAEDNDNHIAAAEFGVDRACNIRWRKQAGPDIQGRRDSQEVHWTVQGQTL